MRGKMQENIEFKQYIIVTHYCDSSSDMDEKDGVQEMNQKWVELNLEEKKFFFRVQKIFIEEAPFSRKKIF